MTPDPVKIIYLIGQLGLGGSERQLYLLLKHLDYERFDVSVVVFNPSPYLVLDQALRELGVQVYPLPERCRGIPRRAWYLFRLFRRLSPQVVHSWTLHDNPYAGVIGYLAGVPLRIGSVRSSLASRSFQRLPDFLQMASLRITPFLVVNSNAIQRDLIARGHRQETIFLIENCVEIPRPGENNVQIAGIEEHQRVVGMVANLRANKNHLMFVDGLSKILPSHADVAGLIVGQPLPSEADYPARIHARIAAHGMEGRIILAGFCADVPRLMERFSVVCLTSDSEGTPNVILEAMAAARPVVATRVGGVPEIVRHGETGLLVEPGDVDGFARAVSTLLESPDLARRMGEAGQDYVARRHRCAEAARALGALYANTRGAARQPASPANANRPGRWP